MKQPSKQPRWSFDGRNDRRKYRAVTSIQLFNDWAVDRPEYFPEVQGTAQYDLLPSAVGLGQ